MPLAESLGEFTLKATSVKPIDLGGGQTRIEVTFAGEVSGQVPGQYFGTLTVIAGPEVDRPNPWTSIGATLTTSGSIVRMSGQGVGIRTGDGHKVRYRGTSCATTDDPKLADLNNMIAAIEAEFDPATQTLRGAACVWR
jgi:hypothetical protein